ncbi:PAS domain-containing protein [Paenibacillus sp. 19GGS1-52]|uniref:CheR family methyltransferase n=1 Tax=Paenibacillus sp. 19GGS1-52 TaxID=2758563 RepID=UPI001EFB5607|nr:CheR family methyltransferase [Paenibacillus sp. 19GGS1-52]ULO05635.1 PAS domain-containing protein [Paenibacillus sp. 19GGS1-52]
MEKIINYQNNPEYDRIKEFSVVGIVASPEKLEGLEQFLDHLDIVHGLTYFIAHHDSIQSDLFPLERLSKHTHMMIFHAVDQMEIHTDCIYLLPPHHDISFQSRTISLTDYSTNKGNDLSADRFMYSLTDSFGSNSIAILFTGEGRDGTLGIERISKANGLIIVEETDTTNPVRLTGTDIEIDQTDYLLAPEEMPGHIVEYIDFYMNQTKQSIDEQLSTLFSILKQSAGVDFSVYKQASIMRRIQRRMGIQQFQYLKEYNQYLYNHSNEVTALQKDLLIGVTQFFRDPVAFAILADKVLPIIFEQRGVEKQIRVWVAGCSTGEEVYTLAIIIRKYMEEIEETFDVTIFATDLDKESIQFASKGVYSDIIAKNVPEEHLETYFTRQGNEYKVNKEIRQMVIFAQHNLVSDPPFTQLDLILCRNLLIYLQQTIQKKVISLFHFSLKSDAYLFLGPSETLGKLTNLFSPLDNRWNIYHHKVIGSSSAAGSFGITDHVNEKKMSHRNNVIVRLKEAERILKLETVYTKLIEEYVTACIIIDNNNDIIHINGNANQYLVFPKGKPTLNLFKLVPEYLGVVIGSLLHKARKELKEIVYRDVAIKDSHQGHSIHLRAKSFSIDSVDDKLMIIFFEDATKQKEAPGKDKIDEVLIQSHQFSEKHMNDHIQELDQELVHARELLQTANAKLEVYNEELETSNEELGMVNEELIVSNEELQSTNEELQSGNEELMVVNQEYQTKIQELTDSNNDISNFFNNTNIATIFLDAKMNIRKFTPAVRKEINLADMDIGRSIGEIQHNLQYDQLMSDAMKVLFSGEAVKKEIRNSNDKWFSIILLPYLAYDSLNQGIVVTLIDITEFKNARMSEDFTEQKNKLELLHSSEMLSVIGLLAAGIEQEIHDTDIITSKLGKIEAITDELLILASPQKQHFEQNDVVHILQEVISMYEPQATVFNVEMITKFADLVPFVNCVPNQLKIVFSNIIRNGIEAMPTGGDLLIKVKVNDDESVNIIFSDNGIGIPEDKLVNLGATIYSTKEDSMGLGLMVSYKIIASHQGTISVTSTQGKGTIVKIILNQ